MCKMFRQQGTQESVTFSGAEARMRRGHGMRPFHLDTNKLDWGLKWSSSKFNYQILIQNRSKLRSRLLFPVQWGHELPATT